MRSNIPRLYVKIATEWKSRNYKHTKRMSINNKQAPVKQSQTVPDDKANKT
jgi:hypothetical protein